MNTVRIGEREIGPGRPAMLVAEIGINHNGRINLARSCIDAAVLAGADAVKFQNYRTEDFVTDRSLKYAYECGSRRVVESQYEMFKRCELSPEALAELKQYCDRRGILFHSTPTAEDGVRTLVALGAPCLKNGSDYLTNLSLIRAMGRTGLPTILSTGMATLSEIDEAVRAFRETGNDQVVLLHCTSAYPTPPEDVNLYRIPALAAVFGCPVGFSDHTAGIAAAVGAVALGACWIEKHFTIDRSLPGPDHRFSSDRREFAALVEAVRTVERALGTSRIEPAPSEEIGRREYRLSCVAAESLRSGQTLAEHSIAFRRPGTGLPPSQAPGLVGRRVRRDINAGEQLTLTDVE